MTIITVTDSRKNPIYGAFVRVILYTEGDEQPYTIITNPEGKCGIDDRARTYIFVVTFGKKRAVTTQKSSRGEIRITI
jgi:hypothetical protein